MDFSKAFLPASTLTGNSVVTALVTGDTEKARKIAEQYGIDTVVPYENYDALLCSDLIDAVYIAVPNPMHASFAISALRHGKHVMVEKPIATSLADAEAMIRSAQQTGALLMTSYRLHHDIGTVEALKSIRSGAIGDPRFFPRPSVFNPIQIIIAYARSIGVGRFRTLVSIASMRLATYLLPSQSKYWLLSPEMRMTSVSEKYTIRLR